MFILADFRKNNTCGDILESRIYRKTLTFFCSSYATIFSLIGYAEFPTEEGRTDDRSECL
jgi:hypothetical protein